MLLNVEISKAQEDDRITREVSDSLSLWEGDRVPTKNTWAGLLQE